MNNKRTDGCPKLTQRRVGIWYVYVIGVLEGCYKIGYSSDPEIRATSFGVLPVELRVVKSIATLKPLWLESYLHRAFTHRHVAGEWFRLTREDLVILETPYNIWRPEDVPEPLAQLHTQNPAFVRAAKGGMTTRESAAAAVRRQLLMPENESLLIETAAALQKIKRKTWFADTLRSVGLTWKHGDGSAAEMVKRRMVAEAVEIIDTHERKRQEDVMEKRKVKRSG